MRPLHDQCDLRGVHGSSELLIGEIFRAVGHSEARIGPPVVPFYPVLGGGFGCPTKVDYRNTIGYPYSNLSTEKNLVVMPEGFAQCCVADHKAHFHCCWETFYMFACCGLVVEIPTELLKLKFLLPFQRQPNFPPAQLAFGAS